MDESVSGGRPRATTRYDLGVALLSVWFVAGLFLDAWAHNNLPELESFFTWWHAVFYSGFTATAAWVLWPVLRAMLDGRRGAAAVPLGYGLTVVAIPFFAAAGVGDMIWHLTFGIEQGLNILFSPTHLVLVTAMGLIVSGPVRSSWDRPAGDGWRGRLPLVLGWTFTSMLVLLFVQYGNALTWAPSELVRALSMPTNVHTDDQRASLLAAGVLVTTTVLVGALLLLVRRGPLPQGAATILFAAAAGLSGAVSDFASPSSLLVIAVAGAVADGWAAWLRPAVERPASVIVFAGLTALTLWGGVVGAAMVDAGVPTIVEYWTGLPAVGAVFAALLGVVVATRPADKAA